MIADMCANEQVEYLLETFDKSNGIEFCTQENLEKLKILIEQEFDYRKNGQSEYNLLEKKG